MVLIFYYDLLSQPCRSVYMFLKTNDIEFEAKEIELPKGGHLSPEVIEKNPFHKVPFIVDNDFVLAESAAIMRYLAKKYKVKDNWLGKDPKTAAKIDEFTNWQHSGLRKPRVETFFPIFVSKAVQDGFKKNPLTKDREDMVKNGTKTVRTALQHMEAYFLGGNQFTGGKEISIADLMAFNELAQLRMTSQEELYKENSKLNKWMERVEGELQPLIPSAMTRLNQMKRNWEAAKDQRCLVLMNMTCIKFFSIKDISFIHSHTILLSDAPFGNIVDNEEIACYKQFLSYSRFFYPKSQRFLLF